MIAHETREQPTDSPVSPPRLGRQLYPATEHSSVDIPIQELLEGGRLDLYPEVVGRDYFRIYLRGEHLVFQAGGFIGLIPINNRVAIDVRPRVPVGNLERMLIKAGHAPAFLTPHLRYYELHNLQAPSILDAFALGLIDALRIIDLNGKHRDYYRISEDSVFPRGRVELGPTIRRHLARSVRHRVVACWFEPSVDVGVNRCLKYAVWTLAQRYHRLRSKSALQLRIQSELNRCYRMFDGIKTDLSERFLLDEFVAIPGKLPPLRAYYKDALEVAKAVISNEGIVFMGGRQEAQLSSFVIHLDKVFEGYVRSVLVERLPGLDPELEVLDGNISGVGGGKKALFERAFSNAASRLSATPDIVVSHSRNRRAYPAVVEVKYKLSEDLPDRDDMNQALTYGASYNSPNVVLVYPWNKKGQGGLRKIGSLASTSVHQYFMNLDTKDIDLEEAHLALAIQSLCL